MTDAQQQNPAVVRSIACQLDSDRPTLTIHRGIHAAALHLAHHHIASYEAYANQPTLDHDELRQTLFVVTTYGVDLETALTVAHELANHFLPSYINGKPPAVLLNVTDCESSLGDVGTMLDILRAINRRSV